MIGDIADFVCLEKKLVIEIDEEIHQHQKEYDEERTFYLKQYKLFFQNEIVKLVKLLAMSSVLLFPAFSISLSGNFFHCEFRASL